MIEDLAGWIPGTMTATATPPAVPIAELVLQARGGDTAAFGVLYALFAERVYRYCRSRVREPRDAEDLMQLTFLRAIEALPRYEERGAPFTAWLFRLARNAVIDHVRTSRSHADISVLEAVEAANADPGEHPAVLDRPSLLAALEALTPDQRDVLALRFFADLQCSDVARIVGKREDTVRALQSRGLATLRRRLDAGRPAETTAISLVPRTAGSRP